MTTSRFTKLPNKKQLDYLKRTAILIHKVVKGNLIISLYWSKDFVFEVLAPKNKNEHVEIKCYNRFEYLQS
jgi:hypothetical protein